MHTWREYLRALYISFLNDYLTVARFAEDNGLTEEQGKALIDLARDVYNSKHPDE
jgi:deoxyribodipyrimidine photolyase-like uncharacterized protein